MFQRQSSIDVSDAVTPVSPHCQPPPADLRPPPMPNGRVWQHLLCGALLVVVANACSRDDNDKAPTSASNKELSASAPSASIAAPNPPLPKQPEPEPPYNVLLITIDSMRADMPWNGYERQIAPYLSKYQEKHCTTYTQSYTLSSYTAKSVVPMLVGEYPSAMTRDGKFFTRYPDESNVFVSERAQEEGHRTLAAHTHGYFLPALGNNQGFDDYRLIPGGVDLKAVTSITSDKLTKLAREMLADPKNTQLQKDKAFFAYFHYMDPHHTYEKHKGHPDFGTTPRDRYDNEMHYTDAHVGELLDWVQSQPWGERTAVIISADHGEGFGEHGHYRHAYELWESIIKVPLMVCVPGAKPQRLEVRRGHIDLAPTIADLMDVSAAPPFRGTSLVPEVFGEKVAARRIVSELPRCELMDRRRAVIADGYKIISFGNDARFQVYHLDKDPNEERELSDKHPALLEKMKKVYEEVSSEIPIVEIVGHAELKGAPPGQRW